jgi:signal transduction histidine kinase
MTQSPALLIAKLEPSRGHERAALGVCLLLLAVFAAALPFSHVHLRRVDSIIPLVSTAMFIGDSITAVLLFGQFAVLRTRSLLVLATGYLFTGLIVIPYALTFPGAFTAGGLLGAGPQTAASIFLVWHLGLPVTIVAYALLENAGAALQRVRMPVSKAIAAACFITFLATGIVTWVTTAFHDWLPQVSITDTRLIGQSFLLAAVVFFSFVAVVVLWARRRSVLDLWLLVVAFAWLLDSILTYYTESRFTVVWYANRVVRVVSANVVLFVLISESARIYARLAASIMAQRHERESRAMTLEAMSAAIEHEVRQPLAAIMANAGAAVRWMDHTPPNIVEAREAAAEVSHDATRATEMLHAVRQIFARSDEEQTRFDANRLVEEAIAMVRAELNASHIGVQLQLARPLPEIVANRAQLQEVIVNLVHNAADAMRGITDHATVLSVITRREDDRIEICVADTGSGIPEKNPERIFEPFFTTKAHGSGMGLAICRSIVERHGGSLSAARSDPFGSVFRVVLPCRT